MESIWRAIPGYEGYYEANSIEGKIRSVDRIVRDNAGIRVKKGVILKEYIRDRHHYVYLQKQGKRVFTGVARLVAFTFPEICGKWFEGAEANHKDENPDNNSAFNINWLSKEANINYGTRNERASKKRLNHPSRSNRVRQYDLNGNFIKEWESISEAGRQGYSESCIRLCCLGLQKKHHNFLWCYA